MRWGSGIASRGQFAGADKPLKESVPSRPKGRQRDLKREKKKVDASPSDTGQSISPGNSRSSLDESPRDDYGMIPNSDETLSLRSERSKQDEALFNECKFLR